MQLSIIKRVLITGASTSSATGSATSSATRETGVCSGSLRQAQRPEGGTAIWSGALRQTQRAGSDCEKNNFYKFYVCGRSMRVGCGSRCFCLSLFVCLHRNNNGKENIISVRKGLWICLPPYFSGPGKPGLFFCRFCPDLPVIIEPCKNKIESVLH